MMRVSIIENDEFAWFPLISRYVSLSVPAGNIPAIRVYHDSLSLQELRQFAEFVQGRGEQLVSERGEWTADFVDYGDIQVAGSEAGAIEADYISRPRSVFFDVEVGWRYEGGVVTRVLMPPNGWVVPGSDGALYHPVTGLPLATISEPLELADASNYAYFWRNEPGAGLRAVSRECERIDRGAFDFAAVHLPDFIHDNCGHRLTVRAE